MSIAVIDHPKKDAVCDPQTRVTRSLLGYGVVAGPFYVVLVLLQALIRPGFDLTRHDVSLLSNGNLGWIQIGTFILTGAMVVAFAVGVSRSLRPGQGSRWAPRLLTMYGLGLIGAGVVVADPMNGFPAGAPAGTPTTISVHGMLHLVCAGIGFLGLVGACMVLGGRFAQEAEARAARMSRIVGMAFLLGFFGLASGSSSRAVVIAFWVALLASWAWMTSVAVHLYGRRHNAGINDDGVRAES